MTTWFILAVVLVTTIGAGAYLDRKLPGGPAALVARRRARRAWASLVSAPMDLAMLEALREVDAIGTNARPIAIPECAKWCGLPYLHLAVPLRATFRVDTLAFCTNACLTGRRARGLPRA